MLKKYLKVCVSVITLFSFCIEVIFAYEYEDPNNEASVQNLITEIFDAKQQYEDLVGDQVKNEIEIHEASSNAYWWPIGSVETTESDGKTYAKGEPETLNITSIFGYSEDPFGRGTRFHSGTDISGGRGLGLVNIIAAKDGIVVYPTADVANNCPSSTSLSNCGGGYGNYVIIQHSDGNYTLYGHLHENSITVVKGQSVSQGQVIGKMGSSGNSTGMHLHFEVREGSNKYSSTVDALNYISIENPRISFSGNEFLGWLNSWEGHTKIDGEYYIVENIGDGFRTVGGGVTLENNPSKFAEYGINIADYPEGSKIPIEIVDQIEMEIVNQKRSYIEGVMSENDIQLEENEIQALISNMYNIGNINGFTDNYKKYGNTKEFYDNWFFRAIRKDSQFEKGLTRRRNAEWSLFHEGIYIYNK